MQLAYSVVEDVDNVEVLMAGTRKDECEEPLMLWDIIVDGLLNSVGEKIFDAWLKRNEHGERKVKFMAVENEKALEDPGQSGILELQRSINSAADSIVNKRKEIPLRWIAFVEELEKLDRFLLTSYGLLSFSDNFPGFSNGAEQDILDAMSFFGGQGRIQKYQTRNDDYVVFTDPSKITEAFKSLIVPKGIEVEQMSSEH